MDSDLSNGMCYTPFGQVLYLIGDSLFTMRNLKFVKYKSCFFLHLSAAYNQISSSIPTIDMEMDQQQQRHASDENDAAPIVHPLIQSPTTIVPHPQQITRQESDPFVSPSVQSKVFA